MNEKSTARLIKNPAERAARSAEKRQSLLRFLKDEVYTNADIVGLLLGLNSRQAVHATLTSMERDGLVTRATVETESGRKATLWGITPEGQFLAFDPATEKPESRYFEPSRVGLSILLHTLDAQKIRILAERAGWSNWIKGDRVGLAVKQGRPDALLTSPTGEVVALEIERTHKTYKRYQAILLERLRQIRAEKFSKCVWLVPSQAKAERLRVVFKTITSSASPTSPEGTVFKDIKPGMLSVKTYGFFNEKGE